MKVTGLTPGNWDLRIDEQKIATFSAEQLGAGINLSRYRTPMFWEQSRPVTWGTGGRKDIQTIRRQILVSSGDNAHWKSAAQSLDEVESQNWQSLRNRVQPKARTFELSR